MGMTMAGPAAVQQDSQTQPVKKPSLWRQILGVALISGSAGLAGRTTEEAAAMGSGAIRQFEDRQLNREMMMREEKRKEEAMGLQRQQVGIQQQQAETQGRVATSQIQMNDAQIAVAQTNKLILAKTLEFLPEQQRLDVAAKQSGIIKDYTQSGLQIDTTLDDDPAVLQKFMETARAEGKKPTDFMAVHNIEKGKVVLFRRDDTKTLSPEIAKSLSKSMGFTLPSGTPLTVADTLISSFMARRTSLDVAIMQAAAQASAMRWSMFGKMPPAMEKQLMDSDIAEKELQVVQTLFEQHPNWVGGVLTTFGKEGAGNIKGTVKEKMGEGFISPDEALFRNTTNMSFTVKAHDLFGAAFTKTELTLALRSIPNTGMSGPTFRAAVATTLANIQRAKKIIMTRYPLDPLSQQLREPPKTEKRYNPKTKRHEEVPIEE